jgi:FMN phosphatase YigB (HAD superfamily)
MAIKAVIFDAFGTVVQIHKGVHPYRQILKEGIRQGRRPKPDDAHILMTHKLSLKGAAQHFEIEISQARLDSIQQALDNELARIQPYPDGQEAIELLQREGIKVGICSNLAMPYGSAVKRLYPNLDAYGFSYEVGVLKPDPLIYRTTCDLLQVEPGHFFDSPGQVAMIGDSQRCDRDGPRAFGIKGFYLDRNGDGRHAFNSLVEFARLAINANLEK